MEPKKSSEESNRVEALAEKYEKLAVEDLEVPVKSIVKRLLKKAKEAQKEKEIKELDLTGFTLDSWKNQPDKLNITGSIEKISSKVERKAATKNPRKYTLDIEFKVDSYVLTIQTTQAKEGSPSKSKDLAANETVQKDKKEEGIIGTLEEVEFLKKMIRLEKTEKKAE